MGELFGVDWFQVAALVWVAAVLVGLLFLVYVIFVNRNRRNLP